MNAIDEFLRLQAAATKAPWLRDAAKGYSVYSSDGQFICGVVRNCSPCDVEFIAFCRNSDIGRIAQDLAERLERIRAKVEAYKAGQLGVGPSIIDQVFDLTDTAKPLGER